MLFLWSIKARSQGQPSLSLKEIAFLNPATKMTSEVAMYNVDEFGLAFLGKWLKS